MEGREYSSHGNTDRAYNNHHIQPPSSDDEEESDLLPEHNSTYVIQVPKDQIYRIPPPENAIVAERYRITVPERKSCITWSCIMTFVLMVLLFIGFITCISLAVADKQDPGFRVRHIRVTTKGKGQKKEHEFHFTLRSKNENDRADIYFLKGGRSSLTFRERTIAKGRFPAMEQDSDSLENLKLKLISGSEKKLPMEIKKSLNGTFHRPIKLTLKFEAPVRFQVGAFPVKDKKLSIVCNLKVNKLTKNARVLSQDCDYATY
ncbi:NDR1/HIN1-like protein 13 [Cynara cardunculus var. scolymus]|uniref:NDR1/HIN1-like protein 13 n=1 Tax=Cynara cardunculus var. scolymus TaxID=59895 RepID=UPI000D6290F6|nr:NDR1/HIN1-like protein 13 [Cynara cardunculus var. scolymus]